jgi:hypothetical protein
MQLMRNPQWSQALEEVAEWAVTAPIGTIRTHQELCERGGVAPSRLPGLVRTVNRDLAKAHRRLVNVRAVGWKVATPEEQLAHADARRQRARRQSRRGTGELDAIELSQLPNHLHPYYQQLRMQFLHMTKIALKNATMAVKTAEASLRQQESVRDQLQRIIARLS